MNYIDCNFITRATKEKAVISQPSSPKPQFAFSKPLKYLTSRGIRTLSKPLVLKVLRWYLNKDFCAVFLSHQHLYPKLIHYYYSPKDLIQVIRYLFLHKALSVLWYPCQMTFQIIHSIFGSSNIYAVFIIIKSHAWQIPLHFIIAKCFYHTDLLVGIQQKSM